MARGRRVISAMVAVVATATLGVGGGIAPPAYGEVEQATTGGGDGDEKNPTPLPAEEQEQARLKRAVSEAAQAALEGTGSVEAYDEARAAYSAAYRDGHFGTLEETFGTSGASLMDTRLPIWPEPQEESNWCGPGTGEMIIRGLWRTSVISTTVSQWDGQSLTQPNLAEPQYLDAVSDGTYRTDMLKGIDRWTAWDWYVIEDFIDSEGFELDLAVDLQNQAGMLVATNEFLGGSHYNNHPNKNIGHWVAARGQTDTRETTYFVDPAGDSPALGSDWDDTESYYVHHTDPFVDNWVTVYLW